MGHSRSNIEIPVRLLQVHFPGTCVGIHRLRPTRLLREVMEVILDSYSYFDGFSKLPRVLSTLFVAEIVIPGVRTEFIMLESPKAPPS